MRFQILERAGAFFRYFGSLQRLKYVLVHFVVMAEQCETVGAQIVG